MNIFSKVAFGVLKLFPFQIEQIILDLKCNPKILYEFTEENSLLSWCLYISTHHSGNETSQHTSFVGSHLQVLLLIGVLLVQFIMIMP